MQTDTKSGLTVSDMVLLINTLWLQKGSKAKGIKRSSSLHHKKMNPVLDSVREILD